MKFSRNTFHVTLMYSKSLFYKSTLRILKKIMGRGLGGPQNPEKWEKWVKIQTSGHGSRVKKTFLRLHTPGFSIWYIYLVIQGSGQKFWDNFEKKGPPNVQSICLRYDANMYPLDESTCIATGWGDLSEDGPSSEELREVEVPILAKCGRSYNNIEYQICGGYTQGGKDACQGL